VLKIYASERPVTVVPWWILVTLSLALSGQVIYRALLGPTNRVEATALPVAPVADNLRLLTLGEPAVLSKLTMLWLQSFDNQPGISIPFDDLDYGRVIAWLASATALDPWAQYPLFVASHLYSRVNNLRKQRLMVDFIYQQFLQDPNKRWRWLAHAVVIAQHRLHDLPLATKLANALRRQAAGGNVPHWAQQMEIGLMEEQSEYQSAAILIGGLLQNGQITDPHELHFLNLRLKELKNKLPAADLNSMGSSAR